MNPKIIFFDVDGTLIDFSIYATHFLERACARHGLPFSQELVRSLLETNDELWQEIEKGTLTRDELHRIRFSVAFGKVGITPARPDVIEAEFRKEIFDAADAFDGAKETLGYLAEKYTLCVASNAPLDQQTFRLKKAGLLSYFAHVFTSGELGSDKPSKEFWDKIFSRLGDIKPCETVLVGDSPTADLTGGNAYGIKTCWFNDGGKRKERYPCDYEIHNLRELKKLF